MGTKLFGLLYQNPALLVGIGNYDYNIMITYNESRLIVNANGRLCDYISNVPINKDY